jgi:hypothetical protein
VLSGGLCLEMTGSMDCHRPWCVHARLDHHSMEPLERLAARGAVTQPTTLSRTKLIHIPLRLIGNYVDSRACCYVVSTAFLSRCTGHSVQSRAPSAWQRPGTCALQGGLGGDALAQFMAEAAKDAGDAAGVAGAQRADGPVAHGADAQDFSDISDFEEEEAVVAVGGGTIAGDVGGNAAPQAVADRWAQGPTAQQNLLGMLQLYLRWAGRRVCTGWHACRM